MVERVPLQTTRNTGPAPAMVVEQPTKVEGRKVYLRNDSPGIRFVHDVFGKAVGIQRAQAVEVELPNSVIDILRRDADLKLRQGVVNILRIVSRDEARRTINGEGPPPVVQLTAEQEAFLSLASQVDQMDWSDFQNKARNLLGDRYPTNKPTRDDLVAVLQQEASNIMPIT